MHKSDIKSKLQKIENFPIIFDERVILGRHFQITINTHPQFSSTIERIIKRELCELDYINFDTSPYFKNNAYLLIDMFSPDGWE